MAIRRSSPNVSLIALAAIVGMLSVGGTASACSGKQTSSPRSCCSTRPSSDCGCCVATPADAMPEPDSLAASPGRILEAAPAPPCECRADEPTPTPGRPAQRAAVERIEAGAGEVLPSLVAAARPVPSLARRLIANESPPDSPLFLRHSRLLI